MQIKDKSNFSFLKGKVFFICFFLFHISAGKSCMLNMISWLNVVAFTATQQRWPILAYD